MDDPVSPPFLDAKAKTSMKAEPQTTAEGSSSLGRPKQSEPSPCVLTVHSRASASTPRQLGCG